ncbi:MAG TPA: hypothetical protein VEK31_03770 [Xanthobacteraceae bacterium]|nr:hypothetical protein [Xanthobacteraceae bacterium]
MVSSFIEQNKNIAKRRRSILMLSFASSLLPCPLKSRGSEILLLRLVPAPSRPLACVAFRTRLPKLPSVKIFQLKLAFAAAALVAALCINMPASHAGLYGHSQWCAVTDDGADNVNWDCEYETVDVCRPAVLAGNRGFCALNPYWRAELYGR